MERSHATPPTPEQIRAIASQATAQVAKNRSKRLKELQRIGRGSKHPPEATKTPRDDRKASNRRRTKQAAASKRRNRR